MRVTLIGTIFVNKETEDAAIKLKYSDTGVAIAKFTVMEARKRQKTETDKYSFYQVTAFGKTAEFVSRFTEGKPIVIYGDAYNVKKDGKTYLNIDAIDVDFVPVDYDFINNHASSQNQSQQTVQQNQGVQPDQLAYQQIPQGQVVPQGQPVTQVVQGSESQQVAQGQPVQDTNVFRGFAPPKGFNPFG